MMIKMILVLLMVISGLTHAQTPVDASPWEKTGEGRWELPFSKGGDEAVIHLLKKGGEVHFFLSAECVQPGRTVTLTWKMGDRIARGKDCLGYNHVYETKRLDGWINPLPLEIRGRGSVSSERKKKDIRRMRTLTPKELMRLV